jgi:hypothetical protein
MKHGARLRREIPLGLAAPDHTVSYGTVLSGKTFPGTSCQATIMLSLWDEIHSPAPVDEAPKNHFWKCRDSLSQRFRKRTRSRGKEACHYRVRFDGVGQMCV